MTTSNRIEDLNPIFRPIAQAILDETNERIKDGSARAIQTIRSMPDQAIAVANKKSKVKLGWHQFGLALDIGIFTETGVYVTDGDDPRYAIYGAVAKEHGCIWGGDWQNFPDPAHCEFHPKFTLPEYLVWLDINRLVTA